MATSYRTLDTDRIQMRTIFARTDKNAPIPSSHILIADGNGATHWSSISTILEISSFRTIKGNTATTNRIVNVRFAGGGTNRGPDGLPDAVRFAMGADGTNAIDRALMPTVHTSGTNLVLSYHARPGSSPVDMVPVVSTDLGNSNSWTTAGITVSTTGTTNANGVTLERRQASVTTTNGTRKFLRLRATTSQ